MKLVMFGKRCFWECQTQAALLASQLIAVFTTLPLVLLTGNKLFDFLQPAYSCCESASCVTAHLHPSATFLHCV